MLDASRIAMLAHDHAVSIFHLSFLRYAPLIIRGDAAIPLYFFSFPYFSFRPLFLLFAGNYRVSKPTQDFLSLETDLAR